jgi:hypothetical protein
MRRARPSVERIETGVTGDEDDHTTAPPSPSGTAGPKGANRIWAALVGPGSPCGLPAQLYLWFLECKRPGGDMQRL